MSGPFATLSGHTIVAGELTRPVIGTWSADVTLATDASVTGPCSLILGNMTLAGYVYRTTSFAGQTRARVVGGFGGWRTNVPARKYHNPGGVLASMVLQDAAGEVGERIQVSSDTSVGSGFTRADDLASAVLWSLAPTWRIDNAGTTQTSAWPTTNVTSAFTVIDQQPDEGVVTIATEDYASWVPGATFTSPNLSGTFSVAGITYRFDNDGTFRLEALTSDAVSEDRFLASFRALVQQQIEPTRFFGRYEYIISNPTTTTVDASPADPTIGLPDLTSLALTSDSIATYVPPNGGTCHVMFLDGKREKPICVWTDGTATVVNVLGGSNPAARLGDQTQSFLPPTLAIVGTLSGSPFTGTITIVNPISGSITEGSADVNLA